MGERMLLTAREVADVTGFSEGTIRHFCSERRIPFIRISARCVRFERNALEAWIASLAVPADSIDRVRYGHKSLVARKKENPHDS